ncbi:MULTISPECIES: TM2 domain-containing protein [Nocardioides]|uniref:TM2 domain-containing protein n=1 Tax=Nocardioides vastitatis TaxID=2568655 RepID=A0ABW0ZL12_9ACTN|nr:TM2 domain-containing protein [Nocardioides sp.]THJ04473.1 hypothetical protein E7Z54_08255 [Nocardioides sp.]
MGETYPPPQEPDPATPYQPYQPPQRVPQTEDRLPGWSGAYAVPGPYPIGYGTDPVTGRPLSDKTKVAAGLLNLLLPFVGICGVGRLYQGRVAIGLTQLLGAVVSALLVCVLIGFFTYPIFWVWSVLDGIVILAGRPTDAQGRLLR